MAVTRAMNPPQIVVDQAVQAAAANAADNTERPHHRHHHSHDERTGATSSDVHRTSVEDGVPPPAYGSESYGSMDINQIGFETQAQIQSDGRVNININQRNSKLSNILVPALRQQLELHKAQTKKVELPVPAALRGEQLPVPPMNIVIQIVGSRGDVQPYVALGQVLKNKYGHRVRLATHPTFRDFVTENGLEFFSIGGDPAELMAFMVKNPGLMPGMESLKSGDIGKRRKGIYEMVTGCWRSCVEAGDGTGIAASDDMVSGQASFDGNVSLGTDAKPFVADAIIANPPSFGHVHIAEKLGIPLHLTFTMPWSPTQSFSHPLANIVSTNAESAMTNFISYALVDMLTWQGLGDVINRFREKSLGLEAVSIMWAPGMTSRLKIPYTYTWSPALIPKPKDWGNHIDISGFYFLDLASNYVPLPDLKAFLDVGPPPIYIGFGSIVVDDPNAMTKMIFDAVRKTGQRALVSKGWGGFGADEIGIPEGVFMLGNCPHDWLFQRVSCVVHHGGAGTTAAGIRAGRPTVIVPFFGDQPFWGAMVARAGAGPPPVPYKELTADKLAESIMKALEPESLSRAAELSNQISHEKGADAGAEQFHNHLELDKLRCSLAPQRVAIWRVKRTDIRLSAFAATVLGNEGLIDFADLKLYRPCEYATEDGPWEPITGGASALIGVLGNLSMGVADFPVELLRALKLANAESKERNAAKSPGRSDETLVEGQNKLSPRQSASSEHVSNGTSTESSTIASASLISSETSSLQQSETDTSEPTTPRARSRERLPGGRDHRDFLKEQFGSRSRSSSRGRRTQTDKPCDAAGQWTLDSVIGAGKGVSRIVGVGLKSPMDFTMSLAQGFHNAPKLYGDDTVRKSQKVTGIQSGLKAAGKEFGYGFYDGITGLATQPLRGAEKEGAAGLVKGFAKGIGGLIFKPGAAIWGLPGYTFKGIHAELQKLFGSSVQNYIIAARTAQGYEEWQNSTPDQRADIITVWKSGQVELQKRGKKYGKEKTEAFAQTLAGEELPRGFSQTRHLSWDERKKLAEERQRRTAQKDGKPRTESKRRCKFCPFHHGDDVQHIFTFPGLVHRDEQGHEFETAIQKSVIATSQGNPLEDRMIGRALRASINELQSAKDAGDHDTAYERAVAASIAEANRARAEFGASITNPHGDMASDEHDEELAKVLKESLLQYEREKGKGTLAPALPPRSDFNTGVAQSSSAFPIDDKGLQETLRGDEAEKEAAPVITDVGPEDEELARAIAESKQTHEDMTKQKTEEQIVLDYIKKQSLLEEQHRQKLLNEKNIGENASTKNA